MIPSAEDVLEAHAFVARRHGLPTRVSREGVIAAVALAGSLAADQADAPAALFFALSLYARSLGALWPILPRLEAEGLARRLGLRLEATPDELRVLRLDIASQRVSFDEVRAFFASRLRGRAPRPTERE